MPYKPFLLPLFVTKVDYSISECNVVQEGERQVRLNGLERKREIQLVVQRLQDCSRGITKHTELVGIIICMPKYPPQWGYIFLSFLQNRGYSYWRCAQFKQD